VLLDSDFRVGDRSGVFNTTADIETGISAVAAEEVVTKDNNSSESLVAADNDDDDDDDDDDNKEEDTTELIEDCDDDVEQQDSANKSSTPNTEDEDATSKKPPTINDSADHPSTSTEPLGDSTNTTVAEAAPSPRECAEVMVPRHDGALSSVANFCAICLDSYDEGETIVWSNNADCHHAFHEGCLMDYYVSQLTKGESNPGCPCCRQTFFIKKKHAWKKDNC
jgi:hypothetical protein